MPIAKHWTVDIYLTEKTGPGDLERGSLIRTHAEARLNTGEDTSLKARGDARKNPADRDIPEIGDELAAARALSELSHRLLEAAAADIEDATGESADLPG